MFQYSPCVLHRTTPSDRRVSRLSTASLSGSSVGGRPGDRQANAKRLEGEIVPSMTRAAPAPSPHSRPPYWSGRHGPISAFAGNKAATTRKLPAVSKMRILCVMIRSVVVPGHLLTELALLQLSA